MGSAGKAGVRVKPRRRAPAVDERGKKGQGGGVTVTLDWFLDDQSSAQVNE